ncbi:hypothetical protein PVK06_024413 [Gossypium arboreum]|uniref:DUF4283 domain-containing protein n=1 Tax=Gossypium arboreum TaxID=29729 RepID=A0ABR0PDZ3_GOSAR|nr:hypothetical protein PVK06_024413 [Gossypium arboreum]
MEDKLANLALLDGKEEAFQEKGEVEKELKLCLLGEDLDTLLLLYTEFWVQIPDLPPGLMLEVMARQFGSFLSSFLDYDTKISLFAVKQFMRIKVHLDVRVPLKKIVLGASRMVYARFQHEKLSMFCFLHGKLGHGESFCPLKVRIDSAKILFGWNISLHVSVRRGSSMVIKGDVGVLVKVKLDRLALPYKAAGCNENLKLECLWVGETTGCKSSHE